MTSRRIILVVLAAGLLITFFFFTRKSNDSVSPIETKFSEINPPTARSTSAPARIDTSAKVNFVATDGAENKPQKGSNGQILDRPRFISAVAPAQKHAGENDIALQKAQTGVRDYQQAFHQNPVGNNVEITKRLLGQNTRKTRFLPADAQINTKGQLIDRWDQPIFFHQISANVMDVRSAGPDRIMWTADDEVLR